MTAPPTPTPIEIGRAHAHDIKIRWNDGVETIYPARFLRLACPCAGCIEEMSGKNILDEGAVPEDVHPLSIQAVGLYAIQIQWSDGHATGIYTWERLHGLSRHLRV